MAVERQRRVEVRPFPSNRRLVTAAMRAGRRKMPMYGLVDVDVTTANRLLASHDPPGSLTAFVVASVARAAAAHPEVHAYRNWRGRLVTHHHVDVGTMVEISTPQGPFAMLIENGDPAHPVLLYLHGGLPEYFLTDRYPTGLETISRWSGGNSAAPGSLTARISRPKP